MGAGFAQRPAGGVHHQALLMLGRIDFPQFLDAQTVVLGIDAFAQVEFFHQPFAQVAAAAFGEHGVLGVQLHAGGVAGLLLAVVVDAGIAGGDAFHRAVLVIEHFGGGEAGEHFDTEAFRLFGEPAAQVAQGNNVVALVVHGLGHERVGHLGAFLGAGEVEDFVAADFGVQRGAEFFPVGEQLVKRARLEYRAGEDMGAYFRAFLHHHDAEFLTAFLGDLTQAACGCQTGRTGADDDDVDFHRFAFHSLSPSFRFSWGGAEYKGILHIAPLFGIDFHADSNTCLDYPLPGG